MPDILEFSSDGWRRNGAVWRPRRPLYAVIGDPVAHSRSPAMQTAALQERGIAADYLAARVRSGDLRRLKAGGPSRGLAGFNVTAPHKEAAAALCDGRTDQARSLGAVNTIKVEDGRWLGHNTDSGGILAVLTEAWGDAPPARAVVLGAGGSARAAVDALLRWSVERIEVRNRSAAGRERIGAWLATHDDEARVSVGALECGSGTTAAGEPTVWVGCLAGGVAVAPHLAEADPATDYFLDLRYGDQRPEERLPYGLAESDGLPMLLMQGGLAFTWWFGPPVPWSVMRAALG